MIKKLLEWKPMDNKALRFARTLFRRYALGHWWRPMQCGWPYPPGYCCHNPYTNCVLETGLTRDQAESICAMMNAYI